MMTHVGLVYKEALWEHRFKLDFSQHSKNDEDFSDLSSSSRRVRCRWGKNFMLSITNLNSQL